VIGLALAGALACVPLAQADAFGDIAFDERLTRDDARFASVRCDDDGCTGRDGAGVEYHTDGEWILQKIVAGRGPSDAFRDRLVQLPESTTGELTAALCIEASWITLKRDADGGWTYGLFAQP
jgi:hypothetical protein